MARPACAAAPCCRQHGAAAAAAGTAILTYVPKDKQQGQQQQQLAEQQQQHFHALRQELTQRFYSHAVAVDTRFDAMEARIAAVEQQQQGGADTDAAAAAAAAWDADTVRDALNQVTADHQVVVSVPEGMPVLSADRAATAAGVRVQAVTQHKQLKGAFLVEMGTAQAAQHRAQQWKAAGRAGQGFSICREKTTLGAMRARAFKVIEKGLEGELGRVGRGDIKIYRAANLSNILLSMGTYAETMGRRAAFARYPVWKHFHRNEVRGYKGNGWEFNTGGKGKQLKNMERLGEGYLAGVLCKLPPAPAPATQAAAAAASVSASPAARAAATGAAAAAAAAAAAPAAPTAGPSQMEYNVGGMTRPREPSNLGTPAAKVARAGAASSGAARAAQGSTAGQGSGGAGGSGAQ